MDDIYGRQILKGDEVILMMQPNSFYAQMCAGKVHRVVTESPKGKTLKRPYLEVHTIPTTFGNERVTLRELMRFVFTDGVKKVYNSRRYVCVTDMRIGETDG